MDSGLNKRDFGILFVVMLTTGAGNTALQSVLPLLGRSIKAPDYLIAAIFSVSAAIWVIAAPYWAKRSERQGRRNMVLVGGMGFSVSILLVGMVLTAGILGLIGPFVTIIAVILARMIYGAFGSAAPPAAQAMVALRTRPEQRTKALTLLGSAFGLGTILGPAMGKFMVFPALGLAGPAYAFALLGFIIVFFAWRMLPADQDGEVGHGAQVSYPSIGSAPTGASITAALEPRSEVKLSSRDPRIRSWMITGLVSGHAQAMAGAAIGFLVLDRLGLDALDPAAQEATTAVFMTGAAAALLVQWGIIPLLSLTPRMMVLIGLVVAAAGLAMNATATSLFGISIAYAISCMGFGFVRPAVTSGSSLAVGRELQGAVAGRVTANNGASFILGPSIGVGLYELSRPLPYFVGAAALIALFFFAMKAISSSPPSEPASRA